MIEAQRFYGDVTMIPHPLPTFFAPAERADPDMLRAQNGKVARHDRLRLKNSR